MSSTQGSELVIEGYQIARLEEVEIPTDRWYKNQVVTRRVERPEHVPLFIVECYLEDDTPYCFVATDLEDQWDVLIRIISNNYVITDNFELSPARRQTILDFFKKELEDI